MTRLMSKIRRQTSIRGVNIDTGLESPAKFSKVKRAGKLKLQYALQSVKLQYEVKIGSTCSQSRDEEGGFFRPQRTLPGICHIEQVTRLRGKGVRYRS
jgi:hypothetical protein